MARYKIKYRVKPERGSAGFSVVRENRYSSQSQVLNEYGDEDTACAVARVLNAMRISEKGAVDDNPTPPRRGRS